MNLNKEQKEYMFQEYLGMISDISNKEYQWRVWVRNEGPECQAFDDAVCDFFDVGNPIVDNYQDFGISEIQLGLLNDFREVFREYSYENDFPELFIDTPEWTEITLMAKKVLEAFNYPEIC